MKTTDEVLLDGLRLATLNPGRGLQMALGVERERQKRNDGGQDHAGRPQTANVHESHDVTPNCGKLVDMPFPDGIKQFGLRIVTRLE